MLTNVKTSVPDSVKDLTRYDSSDGGRGSNEYKPKAKEYQGHGKRPRPTSKVGNLLGVRGQMWTECMMYRLTFAMNGLETPDMMEVTTAIVPTMVCSPKAEVEKGSSGERMSDGGGGKA